MSAVWEAWAAGIFEGEGCVTPGRRPHRRPCPRATINMTDEDVVRRFAEVVGGEMLGPYDRGPDRKPLYVCQRSGFAEVRRVFQMFEPFLGERRRARFAEILALEPEPGDRGGHFHRDKTHCKRGHPLSGANLYIRPDRNGRCCRQCIRDTAKRIRDESRVIE